jgi:hypothetical protein
MTLENGRSLSDTTKHRRTGEPIEIGFRLSGINVAVHPVPPHPRLVRRSRMLKFNKQLIFAIELACSRTSGGVVSSRHQQNRHHFQA